jgi:hypothetical protein
MLGTTLSFIRVLRYGLPSLRRRGVAAIRSYSRRTRDFDLLIAVSVTVATEEWSNAVVELLGRSLVFSVRFKHTVVIDRS